VSKPNSRDPETDPAAALGQTLRRLREAAGFATCAAAGVRIGYGEDSIRKGESGWQVPTEEAILKLLDAYKVPEIMRPTVLDMWKLARKSSGPIPEFAERYFSAEAAAAFIRIWAYVQVPGLFQTREYAHAMYRMADLPEDEATERTEVRINRQAVLDRPEPPHVTAVIHESVLHLLVGDAGIMTSQLKHLLELSERRDVTIQVIRNFGYFVGLEGAFVIACGDALPDILITLAVWDQPSEDSTRTRRILALFEKIRGYALSVEESRTVIREAIEQWNTQQQ
jgi:hypothetical protein